MFIGQSLASAVLLAAAFPPWNFWPAAFLGSASLFYSLMAKKVLQRSLVVFTTGTLYFAIVLHWSSVYVGWLPWILLSVTQALFMAPLAFIRYDRTLLGALRFASTFTLLEVVREKYPFGGFGWARLGFTQIDGAFKSLYPVGGVTLVTFLITLVGGAIFIHRNRINVIVGAIVAVAIGFGYERIIDTALRNDSEFKVSAIQGGVDIGLDFNRTAQEVFLLHSDTTKKYLNTIRGSAFVLWPENSVDIDPFTHPDLMKNLIERAKSIESPLIVGAVIEDQGLRNASLLIDGAGGSSAIRRYYKMDLAPFGEYIPWRRLAEEVSPYARDVTDFRSGGERVTFRPNGIPVAPLICFEVLDDHFVLTAARHASVLAIQTNNATFGKSPEAIQQFYINRVRAYELRKPAVIASTTGITAIIDTKGKVVESVNKFVPGIASGQIAPSRYITLRSRLSYGSEVFVIGILIYTNFYRRKEGGINVSA